MKNPEIAKVLYDVADILEIQGVQFKPNAYRKAARGVESLSREISDIYEEEGPKGLRKIPGVGESIAEKIEEMVKTGNLKYCDELKKAIPKNLSELIEIPGMGPKRAKLLHEKLRISSVEDLETAIKRQKIRKLRGFGEKSETDLLKGIELLKKGHERMLLGNALPMARLVESRLKELKEAYKVSIAGSLRRRNETIGDVDILVAAGKPRVIMNFFTTMPDVERVIAKGPTKSAVLLSNGIQADLRVVEDNSFGAALQYFTGNKEHNIKLRGMASKKGLKISEYGVFNKKTGKRTTVVLLGTRKANLISTGAIVAAFILAALNRDVIAGITASLALPFFIRYMYTNILKDGLYTFQICGSFLMILTVVIFPWFLLWGLAVYVLTRLYFKLRHNVVYPKAGA